MLDLKKVMKTNSKALIGSFIFRNEGNGCLTSKYHHFNVSKNCFSECAELLPDTYQNGFEGHYKTTWIEEGLPIELVIKRTDAIFKLTWIESGIPTFEGTAMLVGELLVGAYWNKNVIEFLSNLNH